MLAWRKGPAGRLHALDRPNFLFEKEPASVVVGKLSFKQEDRLVQRMKAARGGSLQVSTIEISERSRSCRWEFQKRELWDW